MTECKCSNCGDTVSVGRAALDHPEVLEDWTCILCGGNMERITDNSA